jgi:hypothetical protein
MVSTNTFKRSFILLIGFVVAISIFLPLFTLTANASINDATPTDEAKSASYYRTLRTCINNEMNTTIQLTGSDDGKSSPSQWFSDNNAYGYIFPEGKTDCKNIVPKALSLWGWGNDYSAFLKELGFSYSASNARWTVANRDNLQNKFDSAVQAKYYQISFANDPVQSDAARYEMFLNVFRKACSAKDLGPITSISNSSYKSWLNDSTADRGKEVSEETANISGTKDGYYVYFSKVDVIEMVNGQPKKVPHGYAYQAASAITNAGWNGDGATSNGDVRIYGYHNSAVERSCHQIQKGITDNASAWIQWKNTHPDAPPPPDVNTDTTTPGGDSGTPTPSSCSVSGIGWIVCPVLTFMSGIVDAAYGFVSGLLQVQPLVTTGGNQGAYLAWVVMRNIANLAFVIAFLIIIFSQLSGVGISNYGVKKLLPRLVIAAILVNVSFWVCAIGIDLSNILGASMIQIFESVGANISSSLSGTVDQNFANGGQWTDIGGGILAGAAVGGAVYYVGLSAFIPAILAALVAIITVFLVLVLRQALIILLIVVSPLAFVAYLLPNTEDLFTKWRKLFTTLLLMYPIIAAIFGASALASMIIMNSANGNTIIQVMGATIALLPLALTPIVMKFSGGVLNRFAGIVNNKEKGPINRLQNTARDYSKTRRNLRDSRALSGAKQGGRASFIKWRARRNAVSSGISSERGRSEQKYIADAMTVGDTDTPTKFAKSVAGASPGVLGRGAVAADPAALQRALAGAKFTIEKAELEDVKAEQSLISNLQMNDLKVKLADSSSSPARQAAVIDRMIKIGDPADYASAVNKYGSDKSAEHSVIRQTMAASLREAGPQFLKASDLDNISTGNLKSVDSATGATITKTLGSMARDNIKQGVYSEEKLASEAAVNIKFAFSEADLEGKQRMVNTAAALKNNDNLKGKIKHNAQAIENLSKAQAP